MKHLAESRSTQIQLCSRGEQWIVVHFFFDYRAGSATANKPLGMLKLFLRQLMTIKEAKEQLHGNVQEQLKEDNLKRHIDVFATVLRSLPLRVCAFIDGLDEYEGDLWDLCSLLETLQNRTGMKMCLASRPESAFEQNFSPYPAIVMQDHNMSSIRVYARQKITKFLVQHPFIDGDLFSDSLMDALAEKAQGVILWARLVLDEMIKSCTEVTVTQDLFDILLSLPSQLESLYERILDKTSKLYRKETATILHILIENDSSMKAATLFQAWDYIQEAILEHSKSDKQVEFRVAEARLKALLGNLVDFVRDSRMKKPILVRLLHRSLSTYLARTKWVWVHLPERLRQMYPDCFYKRFAVDLIRHTVQSNAKIDFFLDRILTPFADGPPIADFDSAAILDEKQQRGFDAKAPSRAFDGWFFDYLRFAGLPWQKWSDLYLQVVESFFAFSMPSDLDASFSKVDVEWPEAANTAAAIHFVRCSLCKRSIRIWWHWNIIASLWRFGAVDLVINMLHGSDMWVLHQLRRRYPCKHGADHPHNASGLKSGPMGPTSRVENQSPSCLSHHQLFTELLNFISCRDLEHAASHDSLQLIDYLQSHAGLLTPACIFDWNGLALGEGSGSGMPSIEYQNYMAGFFKRQNCQTRQVRVAGLVLELPFISSEDLQHHQRCPYAKTEVNALYHWVQCKKISRFVLNPNRRAKTDEIYRKLLEPRAIVANFQILRQKFTLLAEAGAEPSAYESLVGQMEWRLAHPQSINPSEYPRCGVHGHRVSKSDIENLLNDIIDAFSSYLTNWLNNTSSSSSDILHRVDDKNHQPSDALKQKQSLPQPNDIILRPSSPMQLFHRLPGLKDCPILDSCTEWSRRLMTEPTSERNGKPLTSYYPGYLPSHHFVS